MRHFSQLFDFFLKTINDLMKIKWRGKKQTKKPLHETLVAVRWWHIRAQLTWTGVAVLVSLNLSKQGLTDRFQSSSRLKSLITCYDLPCVKCVTGSICMTDVSIKFFFCPWCNPSLELYSFVPTNVAAQCTLKLNESSNLNMLVLHFLQCFPIVSSPG